MSVVNAREVPTPELDRFLEAIKPQPVNDTLSQFIDWLGENGYEMLKVCNVVYSTGKRCPNEACTRGIDVRLATPRQQQVFSQLSGDAAVDFRKEHPEVECECCHGTGFVRHQIVDDRSEVRWPRPAEIIAEFLGLDEDKMEAERRALLEALRG